MTFLVRSTETTQFSYCNLSLLHPASPSIHTAMCYFLLYHLSPSNILSLSRFSYYHLLHQMDRNFCLFTDMYYFPGQGQAHSGKTKTSVECCMVLFCMDGSETYPKPLSHRARHELDPIPRVAKPRVKTGLQKVHQTITGT